MYKILNRELLKSMHDTNTAYLNTNSYLAQ